MQKPAVLFFFLLSFNFGDFLGCQLAEDDWLVAFNSPLELLLHSVEAESVAHFVAHLRPNFVVTHSFATLQILQIAGLAKHHVAEAVIQLVHQLLLLFLLDNFGREWTVATTSYKILLIVLLHFLLVQDSQVADIGLIVSKAAILATVYTTVRVHRRLCALLFGPLVLDVLIEAEHARRRYLIGNLLVRFEVYNFSQAGLLEHFKSVGGRLRKYFLDHIFAAFAANNAISLRVWLLQYLLRLGLGRRYLHISRIIF